MKRAYFYVGENQRMLGEVKKLGKPFAVVRRVEKSGMDGDLDIDMDGADDEGREVGEVQEELEIVELVKYKIVFSTRPEPISKSVEEV